MLLSVLFWEANSLVDEPQAQQVLPPFLGVGPEGSPQQAAVGTLGNFPMEAAWRCCLQMRLVACHACGHMAASMTSCCLGGLRASAGREVESSRPWLYTYGKVEKSPYSSLHSLLDSSSEASPITTHISVCCGQGHCNQVKLLPKQAYHSKNSLRHLLQ